MPHRLKRGLVQVYTGNGKGKTTAAIGLAIRAAGAGLKVYISQFIKSGLYSEIRMLKKIRNITIEQCGRGCFIKGDPKTEDVDSARKGLEKCRKAIESAKYDIVILDEINPALESGLLKTEDVLEIIYGKPKNVEIVMTGRGCPKAILKRGDLITDMKEVRHPYHKGINARRGIEY